MKDLIIKQGQIRLYGIEQGDNTTTWSEKFSLDVIKSTGMASCKVPNDRIYMVNKQHVPFESKCCDIGLCGYCHKFIWFNKNCDTFTIDSYYQ